MKWARLYNDVNDLCVCVCVCVCVFCCIAVIPQWCSVPSSATEGASSSLEGGEEEGGDDDDNIAYSTVVVSVTHTHTQYQRHFYPLIEFPCEIIA